VTDHALLSVSEAKALWGHNQTIIKDLISQLQRGELDPEIRAQLKAYGMPATYMTQICQNGTIKVEVLHYLMVNPLMIMYAIVDNPNQCEFYVKIGDAWFLQPILQILQNHNVSVVVKRIQNISNFKEMKEAKDYGTLEQAIHNTLKNANTADTEKYIFSGQNTPPHVQTIRNMAKRIQDVIYTGPWANLYATFDNKTWRKNQ
jgi:hypothetical protein